MDKLKVKQAQSTQLPNSTDSHGCLTAPTPGPRAPRKTKPAVQVRLNPRLNPSSQSQLPVPSPAAAPHCIRPLQQGPCCRLMPPSPKTAATQTQISGMFLGLAPISIVLLLATTAYGRPAAHSAEQQAVLIPDVAYELFRAAQNSGGNPSSVLYVGCSSFFDRCEPTLGRFGCLCMGCIL